MAEKKYTEEWLQGPNGIVFMYPESAEHKAVRFEDAQVLEWPTLENNNTLTFLSTEITNEGPSRRINRTSLPYLYVQPYKKPS